MRRIFTIGETVMDIVFKNNAPVAAKAGGSMLNASVTLGRLQVPVSFISEFGKDKVGDLVHAFLETNGVGTNYIYRYTEGKSALALAFLDDNQNASYDFYKLYPAKRLKIETPSITSGDIVMFGSYFGISPEVRPVLVNILGEAKKQGAIIIYDPNFRKAHLHQLRELLPYIMDNFKMADIIKGSDEDFENIFGISSAPEVFRKLNDASKILIYSKGRNGVDFYTNNDNFHLEAQKIEPLSTIGAGDNFNAGLAFGLVKNDIYKAGLFQKSTEIWENILKIGVDFASEVCLSYENYISENFATGYLRKIKKT